MSSTAVQPAEPGAELWLACEGGCPGRLSADAIVHRCPSCGGLIEVQHDLARLARTPAAEWRARFDARGPMRTGPDASGVWARREWVHPAALPEDIVTLGEGYSALVSLPRLAREFDLGELWVKQCGVAHTGSFKDLGMSVLVTQVARLRRLGRDVRAVICASTGDTSAALAAYGAAAGIPTVVLLPTGKVTAAQLIQPLAHGSLVLALDTDFDGCMRVVQALADDPTLYLANSMNPWRLEGQKTVSIEIAQQLGWEEPDWIALPGGNLGNTGAVGAGLALVEELAGVSRRARLLVAQVAAADPFYRASAGGFAERVELRPGETSATAIRIGAPVSFQRAVRALQRCGGTVTRAEEDALADAAALADRHGLFLCPQTAAALAGIVEARRDGRIGRGERVVLVSTAHGLKFGEFKVRYHEGMLPGVESRRRNTLVQVEATAAAAQRAIDRHLGEVT